jgi:Ubiquitin interaction motif
VSAVQPEIGASSAEDLDDDLQRALRLSMAEAERNDNLGKRNESIDTQQSNQAMQNRSVYHYPQVNSESKLNDDQTVQDVRRPTVEEGREHIIEQVDHICCEMNERTESGLVGKDATEAVFQIKMNQMQFKLQQDCESVIGTHCRLKNSCYTFRKSVCYANLIHFFS